ncbi:MAG: PucR family transcriptional regulator [Ruminococcaceae bacterium]|nr:PucR family transcriptional regulator [Oscillospiraceae bacterium]
MKGLKKLKEIDWECVITFAESNMNIAVCSRRLFLHRNTVVYHLGKVREFTGLDPFNFYDLHKLLGAKKQEELCAMLTATAQCEL